jgi:hypothetical protein
VYFHHVATRRFVEARPRIACTSSGMLVRHRRTQQQIVERRRISCDTGRITQPVTYLSCPATGHSMHGQDPELFTKTLVEWAATLP